MAAILISLGRFQDAISACDRALKLDRKNVRAWPPKVWRS
jgi:hypothetical protein